MRTVITNGQGQFVLVPSDILTEVAGRGSMQLAQPEAGLQIVGFFDAQITPTVMPPTTPSRLLSRLRSVSRWRRIILTAFFFIDSSLLHSERPAIIRRIGEAAGVVFRSIYSFR